LGASLERNTLVEKGLRARDRVEPDTTPPDPAQQLKEHEEKLAIDDSDAFLRLGNS
jgi:hypothetical protein